jgi:hypothetical protein
VNDLAREHFVRRFAVATTAVFVVCELMQWKPTFLAAVLAVTFLTSLPGRPPLKLAVGLTVVMAIVSGFVFLLSVHFRATPFVLFGLAALCIHRAFQSMVQDKAKVPMLFLLLCLTTIPVITIVAPDYAGVLPNALVWGTALAMVATLAVHSAWPVLAPPAAKPPAPLAADPGVLALLATAVLVPLMLVYLLFGVVDALPVLVATMMIVANFDFDRGRMHALAMIVANFAGGLLGFLMHTLVLTTPSLVFLALMLLLVLVAFGRRIAAGGPGAAVAIIACNAMLIVFSSALASGPGSLSVWLVRLFQFVLAGAFAVGMLSLLWHRVVRAPSPSASAEPLT